MQQAPGILAIVIVSRLLNPTHQIYENPQRDTPMERAVVDGSRNPITRPRNRFPVDDAVEMVECSGESCRSCSANIIADCVAICCCPCGVVNLAALALIKLPWTVGRRCMGFLKKKGRVLENRDRRKRRGGAENEDRVIEREASTRRRDGHLEGQKKVFDFEVEREDFCARFEAERVWLEFYQVGHLGFGRVSFTGIQEKGV